MESSLSQCVCDSCQQRSSTQFCLACYSIKHTKILNYYQNRLREIEDQLIAVPDARTIINSRFRVRIRKVDRGRELAIEDGDIDDWEILMEQEARVRQIWESEKAALQKRERELEAAHDMYIQRCDEEVQALQRQVK